MIWRLAERFSYNKGSKPREEYGRRGRSDLVRQDHTPSRWPTRERGLHRLGSLPLGEGLSNIGNPAVGSNTRKTNLLNWFKYQWGLTEGCEKPRLHSQWMHAWVCLLPSQHRSSRLKTASCSGPSCQDSPTGPAAHQPPASAPPASHGTSLGLSPASSQGRNCRGGCAHAQRKEQKPAQEGSSSPWALALPQPQQRLLLSPREAPAHTWL